MTAIDAYFPNFVGNAEPNVLVGGIIENMDGSTMYVAETITMVLDEEGAMSRQNSYGHELLHALKLSWPIILVVVGASFGFFQLTQSRIDASQEAMQSQLAEIRTQMSADRESASSDNSALRSDVNQGLNRVADKLDDIGKTLTSIKVDQATQKAQIEQKNN
jgi:soluble cytochrome b562